MSHSDRGLEQAAADRLGAVLEQYDKQCAELVRTWLDMEQYAAVSALVEDMRPCCNGLPRLSVPWTTFLISHSELVFCLWRADGGSSCSPDVQACVRDHYVTLRNLRQSCARLSQEEQSRPASPLPVTSIQARRSSP